MTCKSSHLASVDSTLRALLLEGMHGTALGTWAWRRNPLCAAAAAIASEHGEGRALALREAGWFSTENVLVPRLNEKDLVGELMFDKLGRSGAHQVGTYLRESNRIDLNRAVQVLGLRLKNLWIDKNRRKRPELVGNTHDLPEVVDEREEPLVAEVITDAMLDSRNEIGNLLRDLLEEVINDGYEEDRRKRAKPVMRSFMAGLKRGELPRCSDLADQYAMSRTAVYKHHFTQTLCAFVHRLSEDADLRARVQDLLIERGCPREQAQRWLYPVVWSGWMRFFVTERDPENGDKIGPKPAYRY